MSNQDANTVESPEAIRTLSEQQRAVARALHSVAHDYTNAVISEHPNEARKDLDALAREVLTLRARNAVLMALAEGLEVGELDRLLDKDPSMARTVGVVIKRAHLDRVAEVERLTRERKADDQVFRAVLREKEQAEALLEEARRDAERAYQRARAIQRLKAHFDAVAARAPT